MRHLIVLVAACGGVPERRVAARPEPRVACAPQPPLGTPDLFTRRQRPGFAISEPQTCARGSYIRIERLAGSRKLATERLPNGGFGVGCMDLTTCTGAVNVGAFLQQVGVELHREHVEAAGTGAGPCAPDLNAGYDGWNFATGVHDWKDADALVGKIAELMDRYDLAGYVGASIYALPCFTFD